MNKIILSCFFILSLVTVKAQVVTIPDDNFKAALIALGVDTNVNGQIEESEALETVQIYVNIKSITDLTGIKSFKNLVILQIEGNRLTSLDVSGLIYLDYLDCRNNALTSLDVSGLSNLTYLYCEGNALTSLDVSSLINLIYLGCENNALTSLDVSGIINLTYIYCGNNVLTNLDVSALRNLKYLVCYRNSLSNLNLSNCTELIGISCLANKLTTIDVSTLTKLETLVCNENALTSLDVSSKRISYVECSSNDITSIYLRNGVPNDLELFASNNISLASIYIDCGDVVTGSWSNSITPKPTSYIAPTGADTQIFNNGAKISDLSATGTNIKWYSSPTGGSELATTIDLIGGSFYYASQAPNGCESSERLRVKVIINTTTLQKFCSGAEVSNLYAEGTDVKWYSESTGGTALAATTVLTTKTYYVTETVAGIESARKVVEVIISPNSVAGTILGNGIIYTGSSSTLKVSDDHIGEIQWQSSSTSNLTSFSDIVGANSSVFTTPILNSNIYYRAVVASGVCSSSITLPFKVTVSSSSAIIISNVSNSILNPGDSVNVSFEATDTFSTGNTFYLQLSDGAGNFANALTIGSLQSQVGSIITGNIPYTILPDCDYKFRVTSSLPLIGTPYTSNIQIKSLTQSNVDYAVALDGTDDYIDMGTWFNKSKFTFSFWVKPDSVQRSGAAIADIQNDLILYSNPNAQDNYLLARQLEFNLMPDKWNHVTLTMDGETNTRKIYLYGQLIAENQWNYSPYRGYNFRLGNGGFVGPNSYFKGQFDEVKLWDTVIPPNQILENVSKKLNGDESNLLGYWDFNNGCNPVATDLTSNHHDAILMNGVRKAASTISYVGNTIVPNHSANTGICRVIIYDELFSDNSIVKLTRAGFTDIISDSTLVNNSKNELTVFLNLAGKDLGVYNIEITEPNGHTKFYPNSFTVEQLDTLNGVDVQIVGTNVNRQGRVSKFLIVYQNTGNSDIDAPIFELHSYSSEYLAFSYKDLMYKWQVLPVLLGNQIKDDTNNFIDYDKVLSPGKIYTIPVFVDNNSGIDFTSSKTSTAQSPCSDISFFVLASRFPNRPDIKGSENKIVIPYAPNNGHNFIDGCSTPEFAVPTINYFIHSNEDWNRVFLNACAGHDYCYQTCYRDNFEVKYKAQRICDLQLYNDSCRICDNYSGDKQKCYSAASYYLWGLRLVGIKAFYTNQTYCTGEVSDQPPPKGTGPTYVAPDCNNCPDGSLCFKQKQVRSYDPNEKRGPTKFQNLSSDFKYVVNFENKESATASAQQVIIIDSLDLSSFDLKSFSFGGVGFGNYDYSNSLNQQHFTTLIDLRPSEDVIVKVEGNLNKTTGVVTWVFTSLDPLTMEPTLDPIAGFLPPNNNTGRGQGYVYYSINPLSNLQTGQSIKNLASIIFDNNKPIITNIYENIIDKIKPSSHVNPLNSNQNNTDIALNWTGSDVGSEIKYYDVYYSVDSSEFILWKHNTTDTSGIFIGENNHHYTFYSIATDSAGNVEDAKSNAEASTTISTLGINNNELINNVYVYPNPNKGDFNLVINSNINDTFELLIADLLGRRIYKQRTELNVGNNIIPLKIDQSGIYLVTISNKKRTTTKKVIINK
jgi:hypothetical protein